MQIMYETSYAVEKDVEVVVNSAMSEEVTLGSIDTARRDTTLECNDGADNDGDGTCDYAGCNISKGKKNRVRFPPDTSCSSASDTSEAS